MLDSRLLSGVSVSPVCCEWSTCTYSLLPGLSCRLPSSSFTVRHLQTSNCTQSQLLLSLSHLKVHTRNSPADAWGRWTLLADSSYCLKHAVRCKTSPPLYSVSRSVRLSHRRITPFSAHRDFFIIVHYKYSYWLTCWWVSLDKHLRQFYGITRAR